MFGGTSPFGQSSSSPFGSQSVFGQTSNAAANPFTPKPFGSPNPFGSPSGSSVFGGTSTGVFGQTSSPLATTPTFGASSAPAFGSSSPAFGASSNTAFGGASSSFGGSSIFGQKPPFGGFGSTPSQSSPFGSTFQQTQPAFGSSTFGSGTPFGAASQPTFGSSSTPAFGATTSPTFGATSTPAFGATSAPSFGATSTPAFGATSTPAFGVMSTPAFGATSTPAFGSSTFGSTGTAFGVSNVPTFGSTTPAFGASSSPLFGSSSAPAFGVSSSPAFGSSVAPTFGAPSTPSFSFGSTPAFGQSTSAFGGTPFGSQSSPFGAHTATPTFGTPSFGQSAFGGQCGGSRVTTYTPTPEIDGGTGTQPAGKLESISAMHAFKDKSHEELRWEDYQLGDKGGPSHAVQPAGGIGFTAAAPSSPFSSTGTFASSPANTFATPPVNPFAQKSPTFTTSGFGTTSTSAFSSPFGISSSSPFGPASSTAPSLFGPSQSSPFGPTSAPSLFNASTSAFGSSPFGTSSAAGSAPSFAPSLNFGNTQSSGLFQSTPAIGQTPSPFGLPNTGLGQTNSAFNSNLFSTPSTGFSGLFSSSTSSLLPTPSFTGFSQSTPSLSAPAQTSGAFGNLGQTQPASSGFGMSNFFNQGTFGQPVVSQTNVVVQPAPATNPFGSLPAMPQMSIGHGGSSPSVQYGISSMPVAEKPVPVRISSLLAPRHLSQRRIKLPARKYHPKSDGSRVPFFSDDEEAPTTPKADAFIIPRENPRALVIRPIEQWPSTASTEKQPMLKDMSTPVHENGKNIVEASAPGRSGSSRQDNDETPAENGHTMERTPPPSKLAQKLNGVEDSPLQKVSDSSGIPISGHRAGEAAIVYEHGADIEALMPKLRHPEYYTEPRIQELAAKERAHSGFCSHVKDFVVGRHGYGSIRFTGETDVRRLDLESLVQFNNREVIVYKDESKKPRVGQGLNKPAEVTLLNIKCINRKTGQQYTEGPKVERYKEMLKKKAEEQGAEFVSYDAAKGEWKFKVEHFSRYELVGEDSDDL